MTHTTTAAAIDYSTINREALARLPLAKLAPTYTLSEMGNGCYLDPPGYPTYFTRSVYTRYGNSPSRGATQTLLNHVTETAKWRPGDNWDKHSERYNARMRLLYNPLPIDHPRVRAWIGDLYRHFHKCYVDDNQSEYGRKGKTVIFPVPFYELKHPHIDEHWTDDYTAAVRTEADEHNRMVRHARAQVATPDNHRAVRMIRRFYPDYQPELDLIADPSAAATGDWYTRYAERPTPETCPGEVTFRPRVAHPVNGTWCQVCGYGTRAA